MEIVDRKLMVEGVRTGIPTAVKIEFQIVKVATLKLHTRYKVQTCEIKGKLLFDNQKN